MKTKLYKNIILLFLFVATLITGCMNTNPDEQTLPWGRPADWESDTPFYGG